MMDPEIVIHGEINLISDRQAMGLPEHYVRPALGDLTAAVRAIRAADVPAWVAMIEDARAPLDRRLAAGQMLALAGDPRVRPFDPAMVVVPGGEVRLGLDPARVDSLLARYARYGVKRDWLAKECPRFTTVLASFSIAKYPVTNAEFELFLHETRHPGLPTSWPFGRMPAALANHPVHTVTPAMADAYVAWLADRTGRPFRLPTEYEWEYAAAGGRAQEFPWGDEFDDSRANTMHLGLVSTTPVGAFPAGAAPFGALDMAGNVEEYVSTEYHAYPGGELVQDDLFKTVGFYRVARGGAFNRFSDLARCGRRHGPYPKSLYAIGFRVAEDLTT